MDIFAMGLLIYYCMSGGQHAFGGPYEREGNILLVWAPHSIRAAWRECSRLPPAVEQRQYKVMCIGRDCIADAQAAMVRRNCARKILEALGIFLTLLMMHGVGTNLCAGQCGIALGCNWAMHAQAFSLCI